MAERRVGVGWICKPAEADTTVLDVILKAAEAATVVVVMMLQRRVDDGDDAGEVVRMKPEWRSGHWIMMVRAWWSGE